MTGRFSRRIVLAVTAMAVALAATAAAGVALAAPDRQSGDGDDGGAYSIRLLVSDGAHPADHVDPNLVNAWGLVAGPATPWWVADNGTDKSTLYRGDGTAVPLVVSVAGGPTGLVFNGDATAFVVRQGAASGVARFIFASEDGKIRGWSPGVPPPPPSTQAQVAVDHSGAGAVYKGLAIATTAAGPRLYAADFHNARVEVFDSTWAPVALPGAFVDPRLPAGFAPFGIQAIGDRILVAYAKQDAAMHDDLQGPGLGYVDQYDTSGMLLQRVARRGPLNAPWGLALAPASFGSFGGDLLVGNFGDGRINAYRMNDDGRFERDGTLRGTDEKPLAIDGLWALQFGNGAAAGPTDTLFFTAGPDDEKHGLFGSITSVTPPAEPGEDSDSTADR